MMSSWVGAQDMAGNVWEWTRSGFREYPYGMSDGREESGEDAYVMRGGSFGDSIDSIRSAFRNRFDSNYVSNFSGFRCSRSF